MSSLSPPPSPLCRERFATGTGGRKRRLSDAGARPIESTMSEYWRLRAAYLQWRIDVFEQRRKQRHVDELEQPTLPALPFGRVIERPMRR